MLGLGYLLPLVYLGWSLCRGVHASANPWQATGLEWTTASPPSKDNFAITPLVSEEPYSYDAQAAELEEAHA